MEETRGEQVAFGWAGEGNADAGERPALSERGPSTSRELEEAAPQRTAPPARALTSSARAAPVPRQDAEQRARPARSVISKAPLPPDDELWDVQAAARFLKRSVSWVYHRAEDGTLPVKRLAGWGVRFIPAELRAWVHDGGARRGR
jgi:predicted DNA-binding transcriptional regulator AlpA